MLVGQQKLEEWQGGSSAKVVGGECWLVSVKTDMKSLAALCSGLFSAYFV